MNSKQGVNEPAIVFWWLELDEPTHERTRDAMQCSEISTVTQETQDEERSNQPRTPRSDGRQTETLLRFAGQKSDVEKWASGSTKCNKGDADHAEGKERCSQPVKRWCVAYREADRG